MKIFYVETGFGATLVEASTLNAAGNSILREVGTYNGIHLVRLASDEDILWVHNMGGTVPSTPRTRKLIGDKL